MINKLKRNLFVLGCFLCAVFAAGSANINFAQTPSAKTVNQLPNWIKMVGARRAPKKTRIFWANSFGAAGDGVTNSTQAIQKAIDDCARKSGGIVAFKPGNYLTGALFLKSNVNLRVDENVSLLGSQDEKDYPKI